MGAKPPTSWAYNWKIKKYKWWEMGRYWAGYVVGARFQSKVTDQIVEKLEFGPVKKRLRR